MTLLNSRFLQATFLLAGTIIGVGMFALPFVFAKAGFWLATLELLLLTFVTIMMNLFYGEVILRTQSRHLLPGFVQLYLGKKLFYIESFSAFVGFSGGIFVYILLGGTFLANLLGLSHGLGQVLFFAAGALLVLANLKTETRVNYILTVFLVLFILILSGLSLRHFESINIVSGFDLKNIFIPYGVILFALAGGAIIPEMAAFLGAEKRLLPKALAFGVLIPAAVYFVFAIGVLGATGALTTPEALEGLRPLLGRPLFFLGNAIGFLAAFTSFIVFGFTFGDILRSDFGLKKIAAWLVFIAIPAVLFLLPIRNFVQIMSFLGAIAIGIDSIFILWLYQKTKTAGTRLPEYALNAPLWAVVLFGLLFFLGFAAPFLS
ncbi:MAG: aromatic amino acid transport family protein [Candidatus Sungiibacteriota bacterium]